MERDKATYSELLHQGWKVIEIWQCQLKPKEKDQTLQNLIMALHNEQE